MRNDYNQFYAAHLSLVHAVALARNVSPSQAEDLTQETFLRAWQHFAQLATRPLPAQRWWLLRTLRNLTVDAWRSERSHVSIAEPYCRADGRLPILRLEVARVLALMPESDRELVILRYFLEMNSREIGETLLLPEGTVRRRLADCRRFLAEHLREATTDGTGDL